MKTEKDRLEETNDKNRVEYDFDDKAESNIYSEIDYGYKNDVLDTDNFPGVEGKTSSLKKILLGVLVGAFVGLAVVGIIAAALFITYGTAGVGPLVLGLFGGIGAIATWSSVAAIGVGIVGVCSTIGGFIGNLFSSAPKNPLAEKQVSSEQKINSVQVISNALVSTNSKRTEHVSNAAENDSQFKAFKDTFFTLPYQMKQYVFKFVADDLSKMKPIAKKESIEAKESESTPTL